MMIFCLHRNTTFREKKQLKEDFFEENVFIRPRLYKSDPFGNTTVSFSMFFILELIPSYPATLTTVVKNVSSIQVIAVMVRSKYME